MILSSDRLIFFSSLIMLVLSAAVVMVIDTWSKGGAQYYKYTLNKGLWKFDTEESIVIRAHEKVWAWRKLVTAGFMISNVFVAVLSKVLDFKLLLGVSSLFFMLWLSFTLYYWYFVVLPSAQPAESADAAPPRGEDKKDGGFGWEYKSMDRATMTDNRLPVTIVTGYLGSGKTTLVRGLLANTVGMRVLVIENEIGAEGIDHELLMQHTAEEEIVLMNNGCICCTVRSDLLKTFHKLFEGDAFARLDWVVIETTGLADPAPLIQSLYMDDRCREHLRMDAVVTVVDCKHFPAHLQQQRQQPLPVETTNTAGMMGLFGARNTQRPQPESSARAGAHGGVSEAVLQVSFADRVVLNKTDLVPPEEVARLAGVVARINPAAGVLACEHSAVPIEDLLNIRAFDPLRNRALQELEEREGRIAAQPILIQRDSGGKIIRKRVTVDFGSSSSSGGGGKSKMAQRGGDDGVSESGRISTVSLTCEEPLDLDAFNAWISGLLQERGADLYRSKGILSMAGHDQQFVLQCVHMIFDGERGPPWPRTGPRRSRLVFIGVDLDRAALEAQFLACRAAPAAEATSNGGGGGEKKKLS